LTGESRAFLKTLDPPVKPEDDCCGVGSTGQPFDNTQGHESLDVALDHELVEWYVEWAGDDDITAFVTFC